MMNDTYWKMVGMNIILVALSWLFLEYNLILLSFLAVGAMVAPVFQMAIRDSLEKRFEKKARKPPLGQHKARMWFANVQRLEDTRPLEYSDRFRDRRGKK